MAEEKGEGRGRGKYTAKGAQAEQERRIAELEAKVEQLEASGANVPGNAPGESAVPVTQPTTPTEVIAGGVSPTDPRDGEPITPEEGTMPGSPTGEEVVNAMPTEEAQAESEERR